MNERRVIRIAAGLTYEAPQAFAPDGDRDREFWLMTKETDDPEHLGKIVLEIVSVFDVPFLGPGALYRRGYSNPDQEKPTMSGRKMASAAYLRRLIRERDMQLSWEASDDEQS